MFRTIFQHAALFALLMLWVCEPIAAQKRKKKDKEEEEVVISIYDVDTLMNPIPLQRQLWHNGRGHIDEFQGRIDGSDGTVDGFVTITEDSVFSRLFTQSLIRDIDQIQVMIENLPAADAGWDQRTENNNKLRYLQAVDELLKRYLSDPAPDGYFYRRSVTNLKEFIIADYERRTGLFIEQNVNVYTLNNCTRILDAEHPDRQYLYREMGRLEPAMMIDKLAEFASYSYACDAIAACR